MKRNESVALLFLCVVLFVVVPRSIIGDWTNKSSSHERTIEITGEPGTLDFFSFPSSKFPDLCPSPRLIKNHYQPAIWFNDFEDDKFIIEIPTTETMLNLTYMCNSPYNVTIILNLIPLLPRHQKAEPKSLKNMEVILLCLFFISFLSIPSVFVYSLILNAPEFNNRRRCINK